MTEGSKASVATLKREGMQAVLPGARVYRLVPLILALVGAAYSQSSLMHYLSTEWMVGQGWLCFIVWFLCATVSSPQRVHVAGARRAALHWAISIIAWSWFALAMYPSRLLARNDVLWIAYAASAGGIVIWRHLMHELLLRHVVRGSLVETAKGAELISFSLGLRPSRTGSTNRLYSRCLYHMASIRSQSGFIRLHRWIYGPTGISRIACKESQLATDRRVEQLRHVIAEGDNGQIVSAGCRVGEAFCCEARIVAGTRLESGSTSTTDNESHGRVARLRALLVLEPLLLAWIESSTTAPAIATFDDAIREWNSAIPVLHRTLVASGLTALLGTESELQGNLNRQRIGDQYDIFVQDVAIAAACVRHRYFRAAHSILAQAVQDIQISGNVGSDHFVREQASRIAHAIGAVAAELSQRHLPASAGALPTDELPKIQQSRSDLGKYHANVGRHPRLADVNLEGIKISTSLAGCSPPASRPREVGGGLATITAALVLVIGAISLVWLNPLTGRIQRFHEVPSSQLLDTKEFSVAAIIKPRSTVLLAGERDGVKAVNLQTFRISQELGPPPFGPNGRVKRFAVNSRGSALALTVSGVSAANGVGIRSVSGKWGTLIQGAGDPIEGNDLAALIPGLGRPVLFMAKGAKRLVVYKDGDRTLRYAKTIGPAIEGDFVDVSAAKLDRGLSVASVATDLPGGMVYLVDNRGDGAFGVNALPLVGGDRRARSIALGNDGTLVLVCDDGTAWSWEYGTSTERWSQIRAGAQGLALDKVRMVGIAEDRRQLWLIRDDAIWMRIMADSGPTGGQGWRHCAIPAYMDPVFPGRSMFCALHAEDGVMIITPADPSTERKGSVTVINILEDGKMTVKDLLPTGESVLDVDCIGGRIVALLDTSVDKQASKKLVEYDPSAKGALEPRVLAAAYYKDLNGKQIQLSGKIAAAGVSGGADFVIFSDGRFIKFDGDSETLRYASNEKSSIVGQIQTGTELIDGCVYESDGQTLLAMLQEGGDLAIAPIGTNDSAKTKNIVAGAGFPRAAELASALGVISDENGFLFGNRQGFWRYDTRNAAAPWNRVTMAYDPDGSMHFGYDAAGRPVVAGVTNRGNAVQLVAVDGTTLSWPASGIRKLWPSIGAAAVGLIGDGSVQSFDSMRGPITHMHSTDAGPATVREATIRPTHVDFLGNGTLHSFSRADGQWRVSAPFGPDYRLYQAGDRLQPYLLLLSSGTGVPWVLPPAQPADALHPFGTAALSGAIALQNGIIGKGDGNGLVFLGLNGVSYALPSTLNGHIQAEQVAEVVAQNDMFWARSKDGRLMQYDPATRSAFEVPFAGVEQIEGENGAIYANTGATLQTIDSKSGSIRATWQAYGKKISAIGRPSGTSVPALLNDGSLRLVTGNNAVTLLVEPQKSSQIGAINRVAAIGDDLIIFGTKAAYRRQASATSPFTRLQKVDITAQRMLLSPNDELWLEYSAGWLRERDGLRVGSSIGWLPQHGFVSVDSSGYLLLGENRARLDLCTPALTEFGTPRRFYPLKNGQVLMLGSGGVSIFDPTTRSFRQTDGGSRVNFGEGTTVHELGDSMALQAKTGQVYTIFDNQILAPQFGGKEVLSFASGRSGSFALAQHVVVDAVGSILPHQAEELEQSHVTIRQVLQYGASLLRIADSGRLDLFDPATMKCETLMEDISKVGLAGVSPILRTRSDDVVNLLKKKLTRARSGWFVGNDFTVAADPEDGLLVLDKDGQRPIASAPPQLPGELLASMAGTKFALCQIGKAKHLVLDLEVGNQTSKQPSDGTFVGASSDGFYFTNSDSTRVWRFNPTSGEEVVSADYAGIHTIWTTENLEVYALNKNLEAVTVERLDSRTLEPKERLLKRIRLCDTLLDAEANLRSQLAQIGNDTQLIIGEKMLILDVKGRETASRPFPNPLATSDLKVYVQGGNLKLQDNLGKTATIMISKNDMVAAQLDEVQAQSAREPKPMPEAPKELIRLRRAPKRIITAIGALDMASGWLLNQRIDELRIREDGLEWLDGLGAWHVLINTQKRVLGSIGHLASPFAYNRDGRLALSLGTSRVILGEMHKGEALPHFAVKACAAFGPFDVLVLDANGQVWHWMSRSGVITREFVSLPSAVDSFALNRDAGGLVASGKRFTAALSWENGRTKVETVKIEHKELVGDSIDLHGTCGGLSWDWFSEGVQFHFAPKNTKPIMIGATKIGFDCFRIVNLGGHAGEVFGQLAAQNSHVFVPIRPEGIDWLSAATQGDVQDQSLPIPELKRLQLADGTAMEIDALGYVQAVVGGRRFNYENGRFQCDAIKAVTAIGPELITVAGDGTTLVRRQLGQEAISFSSDPILSGPKQGTITGLAPGDREGTLIARCNDDSYVYENGSWSRYTAPDFLKTKQTKWEWRHGHRFAYENVEYVLEADGSAAFPCDTVTRWSEDANIAPLAGSGAAISYMGSDRKWYSTRPGEMSKPASAPNPATEEYTVGAMTVDRHPRQGAPTPRLQVQMEGGIYASSFRLQDGLLTGLDQWDGSDLQALPDGKSIVVHCQEQTAERVVTLDQSGLRLSAPRLRHASSTFALCSVIHDDGTFEITNDLHCRLHGEKPGQGIDLGCPSVDGFAALNPLKILPLAVTSLLQLEWIHGGRIYRQDVNGSPESLRELGEAPLGSLTAWGNVDHKPQLLLVEAGAYYEPATSTFAKYSAESGGRPDLHPKDAGKSFEAALIGQEIGTVLLAKRDGEKPIELQLRITPDGRTAFLHSTPTRISANPLTVTTWSDQWMARYQKTTAGAYELVSVQRNTASSAGKLSEVLQLRGGLAAVRTGNEYSIQSEIQGRHEPWDIESLLGPQRIFIADGGVLELAEHWQRLRGPAGIQTWHSGTSVPLLGSAFRTNSGVYMGEDRWVLGPAGSIHPEKAFGGKPSRGTLSCESLKPWKIELPESGATCRISYGARDVGVHDGALDMDYALSAAHIAGPVDLLDRSGSVVISANRKIDWSQHSAALQPNMGRAKPGPALATEHQGDYDYHTLGIGPDGGAQIMDFPKIVGAPVSSSTASTEKLLRSWTGGGGLDAALYHNGEMGIIRAYGSTHTTYKYPRVKKEMAFSDGRFEFDQPRDVLRCYERESRTDYVSIRTDVGYERIEETAGSFATTRITAELPDLELASSFSSLQREWINGLELETGGKAEEHIQRLNNIANAEVGHLLLWSAEGERIFVFGDKGSIWFETSPRWRRKPWRN